jgi:hypothetical protein
MFTHLHALSHIDAYGMDLMWQLAPGNHMSLLLLLKCHGCNNCCTSG